jgi:hypothetical protein
MVKELYPVKSTNPIDSHQGLKNGRRGLRKEQEYTREQSYALRDQLKEHWKQRCDPLQSIAEGAPLLVPVGEPPGTTDASGDEDEADAGYEMVEQPCEPTAPTSSKLTNSWA